MKGLIVKEPWITKILQGDKTWEIRSSSTNIRGVIYLIASGTGKVFGSVCLEDSIEVGIPTLEENKDKHCIEDLSIVKYARPHAWIISNPKIFKTPIPYKHPQGAVIWVNIDEASLLSHD